MKAEINEIIGEVVREVLPEIHSGVLPLAHNPVTGETYTGVNQMALANRADRCGDGRFLTEADAEAAGGKIRNKDACVTVWLKAAGTLRAVKLFNVTDCSFPADSLLSGPEQRPAMHDMKQLREMLVSGLGTERATEIDANIKRENSRRLQELVNELCLSRIPAIENDPDLRELQAEAATWFICTDYGLDYRVGRQLQQCQGHDEGVYHRRLHYAIEGACSTRRACRELIPAELLAHPQPVRTAANHEDMMSPEKLVAILARYRDERGAKNQEVVSSVDRLINVIAAEQSTSQAQTAEQTAQQASAAARDTEDTRNETKAVTRERPLYDSERTIKDSTREHAYNSDPNSIFNQNNQQTSGVTNESGRQGEQAGRRTHSVLPDSGVSQAWSDASNNPAGEGLRTGVGGTVRRADRMAVRRGGLGQPGSQSVRQTLSGNAADGNRGQADSVHVAGNEGVQGSEISDHQGGRERTSETRAEDVSDTVAFSGTRVGHGAGSVSGHGTGTIRGSDDASSRRVGTTGNDDRGAAAVRVSDGKVPGAASEEDNLGVSSARSEGTGAASATFAANRGNAGSAKNNNHHDDELVFDENDVWGSGSPDAGGRTDAAGNGSDRTPERTGVSAVRDETVPESGIGTGTVGNFSRRDGTAAVHQSENSEVYERGSGTSDEPAVNEFVESEVKTPEKPKEQSGKWTEKVTNLFGMEVHIISPDADDADRLAAKANKLNDEYFAKRNAKLGGEENQSDKSEIATEQTDTAKQPLSVETEDAAAPKTLQLTSSQKKQLSDQINNFSEKWQVNKKYLRMVVRRERQRLNNDPKLDFSFRTAEKAEETYLQDFRFNYENVSRAYDYRAYRAKHFEEYKAKGIRLLGAIDYATELREDFKHLLNDGIRPILEQSRYQAETTDTEAEQQLKHAEAETTDASKTELDYLSISGEQKKQLSDRIDSFADKWQFSKNYLYMVAKLEHQRINKDPNLSFAFNTAERAYQTYSQDFSSDSKIFNYVAYKAKGGSLQTKLAYLRELRNDFQHLLNDEIRPILNQTQTIEEAHETNEQSVSETVKVPEAETSQSASDVTGTEEPAKESQAFTWSDNYHITQISEDESVSPGEAFERNIAAIEILKKLESENRQATPEEMKTLAGFTSWGGIGKESFDRLNDPEFLEEHSTLTGQDVSEIRDMVAGAGSDTGYYTSKEVIERIYGTLERFGFKHGSILEPSCGTGNFIGCLPEGLQDCHVDGVELDTYSARIASKLYPAATITQNDFLRTDADGKYDVAVGNVPFSNALKELQKDVADEFGIKVKVPLHDAIIAQTLHEVRPGGICALITSTGTLDSTPKFREKLAAQAEFVGTVRLPTGTFGRTDTNSDLIILKRRDRPIAYDPSHNPDQVWAENHAITADDIVEMSYNELILSNGMRLQISRLSDAELERERLDNGEYKLTEKGVKDFNELKLEVNGYLWQYPEQIAGDEIELKSNRFGQYRIVADINREDKRNTLIDSALNRINTVYEEKKQQEQNQQNINSIEDDSQAKLVELSKDVRPQSFAIVGRKVGKNGEVIDKGKVIFKISDSEVEEQKLSDKQDEKIRSLIHIRDTVLSLLDAQSKENNEEETKKLRAELNLAYDEFEKNYSPREKDVIYKDDDGNEKIATGHTGAIRSSKRLFGKDIFWSVISNMELLDPQTGLSAIRTKDKEEDQKQGQGNKGKKKEKIYAIRSDLFTKNVINVSHEENHASEAITAMNLSLANFGRVDLRYMSKLMDDRDPESIIAELTESHVMYRDPEQIDANDQLSGYVTKSEYLSGDIRRKIEAAKQVGLTRNAEDLTEVLPIALTADQIAVQLGSQWIPSKYYEQFFRENAGNQENIKVTYLHADDFSQFTVDGKASSPRYDTPSMKATEIFERVLNHKSTSVYETVKEGDKERRKIKEKESFEVLNKANLMREDFAKWIWQDETRKKDLVERYNRMFNSIRPREFDGSVLTFDGMNKSINLYDHQKTAIGRIALGKSTLLAHGVGAGKTIEMICGAMESKRIGMCRRPAMVVPKAVLQQTAAEFMRTYPGAKLLVADKTSTSEEGREEFRGRIVNGNYDCIIMTYEQFEKIGMSKDYQEQYATQQIAEAQQFLEEHKDELGSSDYRSTKAINARIDQLKDRLNEITSEKHDDGLLFEQLGIDRVFVDEAHNYKNLDFMTLMDGVTSSRSKRADDLFMKAKWLNDKTGGRGMVFATGTPVSNSIAELYTMMRYLNPEMLKAQGVNSFDAWASLFTTQKSGYEIGPTGEYQLKTRFANYTNLPELNKMMGTFMDIKMGADLNLELPDVVTHKIVVQPSEIQMLAQRNMIFRGGAIRAGQPADFIKDNGEPGKDNFLKITSDGRDYSLDPRLRNASVPDNPDSKANICVSKVAEIYRKTADKKLTQMIFCDRGVPNKDGKFSVYDDMKQKLIAQGIPAEQIAFVQDANTDDKKKTLFDKVQNGEIRVLFGSTSTAGTGVNVQHKLVAVHHLDVQWRPSDIEQRNGRIIRQGNENPEVHIYNYITERTSDAFVWGTVARKANFIAQITHSKARSCEDQLSDVVMDYEDLKNSASGDPKLKELREKSQTFKEMSVEADSYAENQARLQAAVKCNPAKIYKSSQLIGLYKTDIAIRDSHPIEKGKPLVEINGQTISVKAEADRALDDAASHVKPHVYGMPSRIRVGTYRGFEMFLQRDHGLGTDLLSACDQMKIILKGGTNEYELGLTKSGNLTRIEEQILGRFEKKVAIEQETIDKCQKELETAQKAIAPYPKQQELDALRNDIAELQRQIIASTPRLMIPEENSFRLYQSGERGLPEEVQNAIAGAGWECEPGTDRVRPAQYIDPAKSIRPLPFKEMQSVLETLKYKSTKVMQYDKVSSEELEEARAHMSEKLESWRNGTYKQQYEETVTVKKQPNHNQSQAAEKKPENEFVITEKAGSICVLINREMKEDDPLCKSMHDGKWVYSKAGGQGYFHKAMNDDSEKGQVRSMLEGIGMHEVEKLTDTKTKENTRENTRYHGR